jgi:hypothetical protein
MREVVLRFELPGLLQVLEGFGKPVVTEPADAEVERGAEQPGIQTEGPFEMRRRVGVPSLQIQRKSEILVCHAVARPQLHDLAIHLLGARVVLRLFRSTCVLNELMKPGL